MEATMIVTAVLVALGALAAIWWLPKAVVRGADRKRFDLENEARRTLIQVLTGVLLIAGAVATWKQLAITEQKDVTERFTAAVERLGNPSLPVRVGAIYTLQQMRGDPRFNRSSITRLLAVYVRSTVPRNWEHYVPRPSDLRQDHPDINAALEVLSRRSAAEVDADYALGTLDLMASDLRGLWLEKGSNLAGFSFIQCLLGPAGLEDVDLSYASFHWASVERSNLRGARLWKASFWGARLCGTSLENAQLQGASLQGADLRNANLTNADLSGATLVNADLRGACGLTAEQMAQAVTDSTTKYTGAAGDSAGSVVTVPCPDHWARECPA